MGWGKVKPIAGFCFSMAPGVLDPGIDIHPALLYGLDTKFLTFVLDVLIIRGETNDPGLQERHHNDLLGGFIGPYRFVYKSPAVEYCTGEPERDHGR
jgi:hypothetical protein